MFKNSSVLPLTGIKANLLISGTSYPVPPGTVVLVLGLMLSSFFFFNIYLFSWLHWVFFSPIISWRLITLQYCSGFSHIGLGREGGGRGI